MVIVIITNLVGNPGFDFLISYNFFLSCVLKRDGTMFHFPFSIGMIQFIFMELIKKPAKKIWQVVNVIIMKGHLFFKLGVFSFKFIDTSSCINQFHFSGVKRMRCS